MNPQQTDDSLQGILIYLTILVIKKSYVNNFRIWPIPIISLMNETNFILDFKNQMIYL